MAVLTHGSARLVAVALLTLAASRAPAVALREAGNDILTIRVSDQPANIGLFTVGSSTMIAPPDGQNLFFDFKGKKVNTSFVTVRDGTTLWVSANASSDSEKPVMAAPVGMSGSLYTLQFMTTWPPAPAMSLIGSNGFVTSYILPGLTVLVEVEVVGSVLADS